MSGATTQAVGGSYKEDYEDFVAVQINNRFPLKDLLKWMPVEFAGMEKVYNAPVSRNPSPMWAGEDSAFADAGHQGSIPVRIGQKKLMARVRVTSEVLQDSMTSKGAYVSARRNEMQRIIDDIARMEEYSSTSDGKGVLCLIDDTTPTTGTTLGVDSPGNIAGDDFGNRFILVGTYVGFVDPATGALRSGIRKVTACSDDGTTITLDAAPAAGVADNDYVVQAANSAVTSVLDTSYEHAAWGLMALFDDGTYRSNYFSVPRASYPAYNTYVKAATGALSEDLLQMVRDVVEQRLGANIDLMTAHHSVRREVIKLTQPDRMYTGNNLKSPDAGTDAFTGGDVPFGGVPIKAIRTHPLATLFGIDTKGCGLVRYGSDPGGWVDEDGHILIRVGSGTTARDAFEAWYRKRYQNHARFPGKAFRLGGITGQTLVVVRAAGD